MGCIRVNVNIFLSDSYSGTYYVIKRTELVIPYILLLNVIQSALVFLVFWMLNGEGERFEC